MESILKNREHLEEKEFYKTLSSIILHTANREKNYCVVLENEVGRRNIFILEKDPPVLFCWVDNKFVPPNEY